MKWGVNTTLSPGLGMGMTWPSSGAVGDVCQKIAGVLQLLDVVFGDARGLPLALGTITGHVRIKGMVGGVLEDKWVWALRDQEIGNAIAMGELRAYGELGGCFPFISCRKPKGPFTAPHTSSLPDVIMSLCAHGITQIIDHIP